MLNPSFFCVGPGDCRCPDLCRHVKAQCYSVMPYKAPREGGALRVTVIDTGGGSVVEDINGGNHGGTPSSLDGFCSGKSDWHWMTTGGTPMNWKPPYHVFVARFLEDTTYTIPFFECNRVCIFVARQQNPPIIAGGSSSCTPCTLYKIWELRIWWIFNHPIIGNRWVIHRARSGHGWWMVMSQDILWRFYGGLDLANQYRDGTRMKTNFISVAVEFCQ